MVTGTEWHDTFGQQTIYETNIQLIVGLLQDRYLTVQDGAEEAGFVDLLTGRQKHVHLAMEAQSA